MITTTNVANALKRFVVIIAIMTICGCASQEPREPAGHRAPHGTSFWKSEQKREFRNRARFYRSQQRRAW